MAETKTPCDPIHGCGPLRENFARIIGKLETHATQFAATVAQADETNLQMQECLKHAQEIVLRLNDGAHLIRAGEDARARLQQQLLEHETAPYGMHSTQQRDWAAITKKHWGAIRTMALAIAVIGGVIIFLHGVPETMSAIERVAR